MLPIGDDDSGPPGIPLVNLALIGLNVAVFLYQLANPEFTNGFSVVPREITTGTDLVGRFPLPLPDGTSTFIDEARGSGFLRRVGAVVDEPFDAVGTIQ